MNKALPEFRVYPPETALAHGDSHPSTGDKPARLEDLTHELRQSLGVIESLAFYLELIATEDDKSRLHLRQIRSMVSQANRILQYAAIAESESSSGMEEKDTRD
jgi:signal transduction histidine kinase